MSKQPDQRFARLALVERVLGLALLTPTFPAEPLPTVRAQAETVLGVAYFELCELVQREQLELTSMYSSHSKDEFSRSQGWSLVVSGVARWRKSASHWALQRRRFIDASMSVRRALIDEMLTMPQPGIADVGIGVVSAHVIAPVPKWLALTDRQRALVSALRSGPLTRKQLAKALRVEESHIKRALDELRAGRVLGHRSGSGYFIENDPPGAPGDD